MLSWKICSHLRSHCGTKCAGEGGQLRQHHHCWTTSTTVTTTRTGGDSDALVHDGCSHGGVMESLRKSDGDADSVLCVLFRVSADKKKEKMLQHCAET